jgi:ubiquinone/menaquinone biosynthesis C-methylase UbiE
MSVLNLKKKEPFLSPATVINTFDLKEGDVVIDFGSGSGYWALPMARIVGSKGLVIAIDNYEENLRVLKNRATKEGINSIRYFKAPYSSKNIPITEKADLILISNILSLVDTDKDLVSSVRSNSVFGTKLVVIDWNKESKIGPKSELRINVEEVITMAEKVGFVFKKLLPTGSDHIGIYFEFEGKK